MKTVKWFALATAAFMFAACEKTPEEGVTSISLDKNEVSVEVGKTITLNATVEPEGTEVTWASSNTAAATVNDGVVTGVAEGTAIIVASAGTKTASCLVTVVAESEGEGEGEGEGNTDVNPGDLHASLQGSEYMVFQLGEVASEKISSKIVADFRVNEQDCFLDIWDSGETYTAGTTSGLNFYGDPDGWVSLTVVAPAGWSGGGYRCTSAEKISALAKIMENPEDYYFHIAMKSVDNASHLLQINGTVGSAKFCVGSIAFVDKGTAYQPKADFTRDGSWGEIEICMKDLVDLGYATSAVTVAPEGFYPFSFLSGATPSTMLQFDAAFIYKKAQE